MKYLGPPQSGAMAAVVASRNTYGQYFRARVNPAQPATAPANASRAVFAAASVAWNALTELQREAWRAAEQSRSGPLGVATGLSGRILFVRQWIISTLAAGVPVTVPITTGPHSITGVRLFSPAANQLAMDWTSISPLPAGPWIEIQATAPLSVGSNYLPGRRKADGKTAYFTTIQVITPGFTSPVSLTGVYNGRFGSGPTTGDRIGWRVRSAGSRWFELARGLTVIL